jgi:hypothetical protein
MPHADSAKSIVELVQKLCAVRRNTVDPHATPRNLDDLVQCFIEYIELTAPPSLRDAIHNAAYATCPDPETH